MSRSKNTGRFVVAALAVVALAAPALAQQPTPPGAAPAPLPAPPAGAPAAPPPITMKQLKPDVWAGLGGAGGNSTIIIGKTGVIVVDAKQTRGGREGSARRDRQDHAEAGDDGHPHAQRRRSRERPRGVPGRHQDHRAREQQEGTGGGAGGRRPRRAARRPAADPGRRPKSKETMTIDGVKLELYHWAPAHTSGDLIVYPAGSEDRRDRRHRRDEPRRRQSEYPFREERLDRRAGSRTSRA